MKRNVNFHVLSMSFWNILSIGKIIGHHSSSGNIDCCRRPPTLLTFWSSSQFWSRLISLLFFGSDSRRFTAWISPQNDFAWVHLRLFRVSHLMILFELVFFVPTSHSTKDTNHLVVSFKLSCIYTDIFCLSSLGSIHKCSISQYFSVTATRLNGTWFTSGWTVSSIDFVWWVTDNIQPICDFCATGSPVGLWILPSWRIFR